MESVEEQEIEAIWERLDKIVDFKELKGTNPMLLQEEIRDIMLNARSEGGKEVNPQANMQFLVNKGFHIRAAQNDQIANKVLGKRIQLSNQKGKIRFRIKKGTATFKTREGKIVKAGRLLRGKTQDEAIQNLRQLSE